VRERSQSSSSPWELTFFFADAPFLFRTSALEEKHSAVSNLILLTQATGSSLPLEVLQKILEVAIPLLKFYLSIEVREASAALIGVVVAGEQFGLRFASLCSAYASWFCQVFRSKMLTRSSEHKS
jgi:hypothetical protein